MQLIFHSLTELEDFARSAGYVHFMDIKSIEALGYVPRSQLGELTVRLDAREFAKDVEALAEQIKENATTIDAQAVQTSELLSDGLTEANDDQPVTVASYGPQHGTEPEPTRRKRRTKAEIEAEKAAQTLAAAGLQLGTPATAVAAQANPLDNLMADPAPATALLDEIAAMIPLFDGDGEEAKLAHLKEGRDFIGTHGFPAYNETMQLAGVPANIAAHTPEERSRHRAAIAWKAAQLAK